MVRRRTSRLFLLATGLAFLMMGCQVKEFSTPEEFYSWINEPGHGLMKEKFANATHIKVNYLPQDLQVMKEVKSRTNEEGISLEEIRQNYSHGQSFVLTLGPDTRDGKKGGDIVLRGARSYKDYKDRLLELNYELEPLITLKAGNLELQPALSNLENVFGMSESRKVNLTFVASNAREDSILNNSDLELIFDDRIFRTGLNRFVFKKADINKIPKAKFAAL